MRSANSSLFGPRSTGLLMMLVSLLVVGGAKADELDVEVTLVWATSDDNDKKAVEAKYEPLDPKIAKEIKKPFKWKYYFQCAKQEGKVPSRGSKLFKMSPKCEVKVTELPGPEVMVELFGEGKPVNRNKVRLRPGELITIGSSDKRGCAWFIVVQRPK